MRESILVRFGAIGEVARFENFSGESYERGRQVVVRTQRGIELGTVLERMEIDRTEQSENMVSTSGMAVVRSATEEDLELAKTHWEQCRSEFDLWCERIRGWNLQVELIDLEWTLDRQTQILYVLCDRGPDSTKLALQATGHAPGLIHVQPVSEDGPVPAIPPANNGCGCAEGGGCRR